MSLETPAVAPTADEQDPRPEGKASRRTRMGRLTGTDQEREELANALVIEEPRGAHLFPAISHPEHT